MPIKLKKHRPQINFEYEFEDGNIENFEYLSTTSNQIEKAFEIKDNDIKAQLNFTFNLLKENIKGKNVEKLLEEQKEANIFEFKETLDSELGKLKKKR